mgnify:CR=1 FL=1
MAALATFAAGPATLPKRERSPGPFGGATGGFTVDDNPLEDLGGAEDA